MLKTFFALKILRNIWDGRYSITLYSGTWHLETRDMETWLDRKHHCSEKAAYLIKYVDLIGYIGIFVSTLETGNNISIHIRVSRY
jgi:hypothetical protein